MEGHVPRGNLAESPCQIARHDGDARVIVAIFAQCRIGLYCVSDCGTVRHTSRTD